MFDTTRGVRRLLTRCPRPRRPLLAALLAAYAGGVLLWQLGGWRSFQSHEVYAVVPAAEMLERGGFVVPWFGGIPRLKKPPLPYWTVAAAGAACGGVTEWSARLPAAVSAFGLAVLVGTWAGRWYGRTVGRAAFVAQATMLYVLDYGRKAEVDMTLTLCVAAALWLVASNPRGTPISRGRWALVWTLAGVTWLGKFHFGPVLIFGPVLAWLLVERRWREWRGVPNPAGMAVFAAAVGVWPLLVLRELPDAPRVWWEETVGRAAGRLGVRPVWYYAPHLLSLTLPWTPLWWLAVRPSWRRATRGWGDGMKRTAGRRIDRRVRAAWRDAVAHGDPRERFLWVWLGVALLVCTVQVNKHKHYLLPALPVLGLWAGRGTARALRWVRERRRRGWRSEVPLRLAAVLPAVAAGVGIAVLPDDLAARSGIAATAAAAGVGFTLLCAAVAAGRPRCAACCGTGTFAAVWGILAAAVVPAYDQRADAWAFAAGVRDHVAAADEVLVYKLGEDGVVHFVDGPARRVEDPSELHRLVARTGRAVVLTGRPFDLGLPLFGRVRTLAAIAPSAPARRSRTPWHRSLRLVEVTAFHKRRSTTRAAGLNPAARLPGDACTR